MTGRQACSAGDALAIVNLNEDFPFPLNRDIRFVNRADTKAAIAAGTFIKFVCDYISHIPIIFHSDPFCQESVLHTQSDSGFFLPSPAHAIYRE